MENNAEEKKKIRRYIDNLYFRKEINGLLETVRRPENADLFDELSGEIWEDSYRFRQTSRAEHEQYKQEAHRLLRQTGEKKHARLRRALYAAAGIAACLCLLLGGLHYYRLTDERNLTYLQAATASGEKKELVLPDGSRVVLNACSELRYPARFKGKSRRIELTGQAYFEVARNEKMPFTVATPDFDVQVLGTRFDVKAYPYDEILSVNVQSGKVQVNLPEAMMRLTAREQVLINTRSGDYNKKKEAGEVAVWRKGSLRFDWSPIRDVARELERVYGCRITFAEGQEFNNLISGEHDNQSLESVLESISFVSGVKYKKEGETIVFYK